MQRGAPGSASCPGPQTRNCVCRPKGWPGVPAPAAGPPGVVPLLHPPALGPPRPPLEWPLGRVCSGAAGFTPAVPPAGGRRGRLQQWRRLGLGSSEGQEGGQWGRGLQARAGTQADLGGLSLRRCWGLACGLEFLVAFLLETNLELEFQERRNLKLRKQPHPRQARTVGQSSWPVTERPGRRAPQGHLASRRLSPPGAGCPRGCPRG